MDDLSKTIIFDSAYAVAQDRARFLGDDKGFHFPESSKEYIRELQNQGYNIGLVHVDDGLERKKAIKMQTAKELGSMPGVSAVYRTENKLEVPRRGNDIALSLLMKRMNVDEATLVTDSAARVAIDLPDLETQIAKNLPYIGNSDIVYINEKFA